MSRFGAWAYRAFAAWTRHPPVSSRHEVVLALAGASIMSGGLALAGYRPVTIEQFVPGPLLFAWYATLAGGGVALLVSAFWRDRLDALLIERPAYLFLGVGSAVYGICLLASAHGSALVAASGYGMYALACLARTLRITLFRRHEAARTLPGA